MKRCRFDLYHVSILSALQSLSQNSSLLTIDQVDLGSTLRPDTSLRCLSVVGHSRLCMTRPIPVSQYP